MPSIDLTRRQAIGAAGATGVAFLLADTLKLPAGTAGADVAEAASATCALTPNKTIGPYFVEEKLNRSDVRESQPGVDLTITMYLFDASADCAPVVGAQVDIWHANYAGNYSDVSQNATVGQHWLRGYQVTDSDGKVTFTTRYPGWYSGRAVHIHFRVRTSSSDFTSQMFFTDEQNATVYAADPYASRGEPNVKDSQDNILGSDADVLTLHPTGSNSAGWAADFSVGLSSGGTTTTDPIAQSTATPTTTTTGTGTSTTADTTVAAALASARSVRRASGKRLVRIKLTTEEPVTLAARLTRSGHRLAAKQKTLGAGTHVVRLEVGSRVKAGGARLTLRVADAAGNSKRYHRSLHIPRRHAA